MKFGNFLFPDSRDPERDGIVIDETLREAVLSDELGIDVVWLGEHHFDGICAYADPIGFAGALAVALKRAALGFAVLQTSLHHPIRLAEQLAVIDNLTKGRLIVGLGRGSSYNIYDYQGFGIDHHEAQDRLEEAEDIIIRAWTEGAFRHDGRFWQLDVPILRPRPYTKPHPSVIRGSSGDAVIYGSPARVAEDITALDRLGLGGIIAVFRMGLMPHALATQNLELFMRQVAPQFR